jgi:succinate dehydrogenase / fumarate reductase, cytochrome b subunit
MIQRTGSKFRRVWLWGDVRHRKLGMWAYALNRLTGIGLVLYLYLHLAVLSQLTRGAGAWDTFLALAKSPLFLTLDVILLAGLLLHGLNGLRLALNSLGLGVPSQKAWFVVVVVVTVVGTVAGALGIIGLL